MKINSDVVNREMARKCLTTKELAEITGLGLTTISRVKKDGGELRAKTIGVIARALEIEVEQLIAL